MDQETFYINVKSPFGSYTPKKKTKLRSLGCHDPKPGDRVKWSRSRTGFPGSTRTRSPDGQPDRWPDAVDPSNRPRWWWALQVEQEEPSSKRGSLGRSPLKHCVRRHVQARMERDVANVPTKIGAKQSESV